MSAIVPPQVRVLTAQLPAHIGKTVTLKGWVHNRRKMGSLAFLVLRDRSGTAQCVLEGALAEEPLANESVVAVTGRVVQATKAASGVELSANAVTVISAPTIPLPLEINKTELKAGLDAVLDHRVLSQRNPDLHAQDRRHRHRGWFEPFSDRLLRRASRHLNEYTSLDVEMGFIDSEEELMDLETGLLRHMFGGASTACAPELALLGVAVPEVGDIPRIPMADAQAIILRKYGKLSPKGTWTPRASA